jgi:hypothetical protein
MASWRKRKKAYDCVHRYESERFLVTDDPYPIYNQEEYCKIGKYDFTWCNRADCDYTICEHCKCFKGSRAMNRKKNEVDKEIKEKMKFWSHCERACKQHGITPEEYADKFYFVSDDPIDMNIANNILNDLPF